MPTVFEDMLFGPLNYGMPRPEAEALVDQTLAELNLTHLKNRRNQKLSGGEKRMAAIATILAMQPKIMLMDEPSTALDPKNRRTLIRTLNALPVTKIIATHDLDLVLETCDRVLLLHDGQRTIADIALATGFASQAHFTSVFKRQLGCSPARWRAGK